MGLNGLYEWEKPWVRDFRGLNRARPTMEDRGTESSASEPGTGMPVSKTRPARKSQSPTPQHQAPSIRNANPVQPPARQPIPGPETPASRAARRDVRNAALEVRGNEFGPYYMDSVSERSLYYEKIGRSLGAANGGTWFYAAALVTGPDGVGRAGRGYPIKAAEDFLLKGNAYLSRFNVDEFAVPLARGDPLHGAEGKTGLALAYHMVELEQAHMTEFMKLYASRNGDAALLAAINEINEGFNRPDMPDLISNPVYRAAMRDSLERVPALTGYHKFDFRRSKDRIALGKCLVAFLSR